MYVVPVYDMFTCTCMLDSNLHVCTCASKETRLYVSRTLHVCGQFTGLSDMPQPAELL